MSAPGIPKKFGREPAAITRWSPRKVTPSSEVTDRVAGSMVTIFAIFTSTDDRRANRSRSGQATLSSIVCAVASWYSNGWNWL